MAKSRKDIDEAPRSNYAALLVKGQGEVAPCYNLFSPYQLKPGVQTMQYRELGRTGWKVSTISFGAWAIGSAWGEVDDQESLAALHRAVDQGVNFFDTADVYGDGRSERLLARLKRERPEAKIIIATKAGRGWTHRRRI
jgi:hypothetical protein